MVEPLGIGFVGRVRKKVYRTLDLSGINPDTTTAGPLVYAGSAASPITSSTADTKFFQEYCKITATSGDNRTRYSRLYLDGAGSGGECLRAFTTVRAACGTAHGAHISLNFAGDTTGTLSGLGVACRSTLHVPNDASWTGGTLAAVQAEIWSDGTGSDPDGLTEISFIRVVNGGDATGLQDIDTDAVLFSIQGFSAGTGSLIEAGTGMGTVTGTLKIKIGSDLRYLPFYSSPG